MSAFRVGDRVKCIRGALSTQGPHAGGVFTVSGFDSRGWVRLGELSGRDPWLPDRFELVEPLKLEVGATVTIGDGKDEWVVQRFSGTDECVLTQPAGWAHASPRQLTVVKAAPKPDYYVNAKGAEPQDGDVFVSQGEVVYIKGDTYCYHGYAQKYRWGADSFLTHSVRSPAPRELAIRDGKVYMP